MTSVLVMRQSFERTAWKRAFADHLIRLQPDLNPDAADEASDAEFVHGRLADPATAARLWLDRRSGGAAPPVAVSG